MYVSGTGPASPSTTGPCFQTSASVSVRQSGQPRSESGCFFRSRNYRVDILEASVEQNAVIWVSRWQGFYLEKSSPCLDPFWLPSYLFLWRVLCGLVVRVTQMLLTIQRCRFGVWDMQAGRGVGRFVRSMATNSSLARRQMQIDFLKWTPTPDPIEWHRRRPANTHCLDLSSEANVWCALIVMSGIRCQRWNQAMQCAEDLQRAWSELCALLERSSAAEIASGACTLCIVHWHKRDQYLGCYSRHHADPWGGFVWMLTTMMTMDG